MYGRPGKPRNAFPLIVDGLRAWVERRDDAGDWEFVSAGQAHEPVDLGRGVRMVSSGKLELDAYADLLRTSAIGISLMASPHPSYPPLEMASLGMLVLTNRFGAKDLSTWHDAITVARRRAGAGRSRPPSMGSSSASSPTRLPGSAASSTTPRGWPTGRRSRSRPSSRRC